MYFLINSHVPMYDVTDPNFLPPPSLSFRFRFFPPSSSSSHPPLAIVTREKGFVLRMRGGGGML